MKWSYWIVAGALTVAACGASLALYPSLPARIPTHWDIRGQIDAYGDKSWAVFLIPAVMTGMMALFAALPVLSPKPFQVNTFRSTYLFIMVLVVGLFGYMHAIVLLASTGRAIDFNRVLLGGMYLFFILFGNVLGKVQRNLYMGVRVPWTIASDRVWNDTHRLASWMFVACGIVAFAIDMVGYPLISFAPMLVALVVPIVYSFVHYQSLERRGEL
jgi:uncharacterized membrane protein